MRKRIICLLLTVVTLLTLTACGKKNQQPEATPTAAPTATPAPTAKPTPTPVLEMPKLTPAPTPAPTPSPTPMPLASPTPQPSATPAAVAQANAPIVTKQPNGEGHFIGESAVFVTAATNYKSLVWTAISPSGREVDMKTFRETFPDCTVIGEKDTTLTVTNLNIDMNGWSFCCTFENENAKTKTDNARLRVRDPASTTGSGSATTVKSKRLRCPSCGSEVPRELLNCPYCGAEIYQQNEYAYVEQDVTGDIFYMDNTGIMYFDSSDRTSTYVDTNTNYAVFNDNGAVHFGNYKKEAEEAEERAVLDAILAEAYNSQAAD